jgi:YVTN family beta-propeller protein
MRHISVFLASLSLLGAGFPAAAADKVEICHFAPGGPGSKAMTVSAESAARHQQNHGDHPGPCLVGAIPSSKVYVTDFNDNELFIINGDSNTQVDTLNTQQIPLRAIASPNGEFVYVPNVRSNSVSVVSTSDDAVVGVVKVGSGPDNVVFSADSTLAYVYNVGAGSVSVVRTADLTVVATIAVGRGDSFVSFNNLAISPNAEFVYVPNTLDNTVSVIETATNQVRVTVPVGQDPLSVAVTPDSQYLYVVNANSPVSVIQTSDHTVIKHVGKASIAQQGLAITPDGQFAYTFGNSQFVQVISTATISLVASIALDQANFGTDIVVDPDSSYVYVPGAQTFTGNGALHVIDTASQSVVARVPIGGTPKYAAISPDGAKVYIANFNTVDVIQTSDNSLIAKVNTGANDASGVAVVDLP